MYNESGAFEPNDVLGDIQQRDHRNHHEKETYDDNEPDNESGNKHDINFTSLIDDIPELTDEERAESEIKAKGIVDWILSPVPSKELSANTIQNGADDYEEEVVDERDI